MTTFEGVIQRIVFRSEEGWCVFRFIDDATKDLVTCTGSPGIPLGPGLSIKGQGQWVDNPKFGKQINLQRLELCEAQTVNGMEMFLGSGVLPGIGEGLAARIVERFGEHTYAILDSCPERLAEIQGITSTRTSTIAEQWQHIRGKAQAISQVMALGYTQFQSDKALKKWGQDACKFLEANPYLAVQLPGIGFKTADMIALKKRDAPRASTSYVCWLGVSRTATPRWRTLLYHQC